MSLIARKIILNNWLVNTTGHADAFIPLDLLQEHMNLWIKVSITVFERYILLTSV